MNVIDLEYLLYATTKIPTEEINPKKIIRILVSDDTNIYM